MTRPQGISLVTTIDQLQSINGIASPATRAKVLSALEPHSIAFIERSPFLVIASGAAGGMADASPRGDGPGFVRVLDDTTLLIPERPGNRLADTLSNIVVNPEVGLILMIPGMDETLRINGSAYITDHADYLAKVAHAGKPPRLAIVVDVRQVYFHCPKAFIRSKLWQVDTFMPRDELPSLGKMILEQVQRKPAAAADVQDLDARLLLDAKENLYHT